MREIPFATLQDVNKNLRKRKIVLFGAGNIAEKTSRIIPENSLSAIADNASNLWETEQLGVVIQNPIFLKENQDQYYIIICTTSFKEVSIQLSEYGLIPQKDFIVSPILNDLRIIAELESVKQTLIFSSGSPVNESSDYGGGIYQVDIDGDSWKYTKKISDNCYGIIKYQDNFVSVSTEIGIFEFDRNFNIIRNKNLPPKTRAHGVAYCEELDRFYIVGSYLDGVYVLDNEFNIIDTILFSRKRAIYDSPHHHCNDCCVVGKSLYVSMFSYTGNWKLDIFDGAVVEIDLTNHQIIAPIIQDLWMPHNISYLGGSLTVLDSLRGSLRKNNAQVIGQFPAFTRGLGYDGIYYYIGQSRNRNFTKNMGLSNNISIDASIVIFDEYTKVSRSLQLPIQMSEIHSIVIF